MFSLNIDKDGRILSACDAKYSFGDQPKVDELPSGDISNYLYINNEYVYDPLPEPDIPEEETDTMVLNALLGVANE